MKKSAALVEFTLTTAMLAFWAIACAAAFQGTGSAPSTNGSAGHADSVAVAASQQAVSAVGIPSNIGPGVTVEAALDVAPRGPMAAERI